ncbi:long-chain fatty acid--CoA ligase [Janibacter sp. YIM B02568]|uniref:acyl-CoA synthetase n=1 Tax=Janibacter endophyticus TaxID=2806261 RepID=UPI00194F7FBB|nr:long-chain fatty acid--CoA ligase [Janibacter endophyticus]MBM6545370.1 long-chain fatty acid--CoA ligase [Janibacter endophyticus]
MILAHSANSGHALDINPVAAVKRNARLTPDSTVLIYEGGDVTYAELDEKAARLATDLVRSGVGEGDRVAYLGLNSPSFLVTMYAAFRVGALFVPINFRLAGPELERVLAASGADAIVAEEGHRAEVDSVKAGSAIRRSLLVDDDPAVPVADGAETGDWERWSAVLAASEPMSAHVRRDYDDPAILMFTSGTTGHPKGVILTHGNIFWNSVNVDSMVDTRRGDVTHCAAPIFHIGALNSFLLRAVSRGGKAVLRRHFDPEQMVRDIVEHKVNSMFGVPAMFAALRRAPGIEEVDLSSLTGLIVAGAPVPPSLITQFLELDVTLQQAWGLTETAPFATHLPAEWTREKLGSAGVAMPFTEVRIVDVVDKTPMPTGERGEIVVRGPNVAAGYWNNAEATSAAYDDQGWFHSGDIGYLDEDGFLFIVDRLKDMIITGGENVYPAEVERVYAEMPGVLDVAVVGVPDEKWGEAVSAVLTVAEGTDITLESVREFGSERLARYKLPSRITLVAEMPRNASGKLDKLTIRQIAGKD